MTLKALTKNFETISMGEIEKVMHYIHSAIHSHTQIVYAFDKEFYDDFFDLMGRILAKAHFDELLSDLGLMKLLKDDAIKLVLTYVRESIDEFSRVLLLKMNPTTFTSYSYPFDKASYTAENVQDLYLEVKLK
jgi:hypothetical protein